jgi:hypothetical protein
MAAKVLRFEPRLKPAVIFASADFYINGERRAGHPMISDGRGKVVGVLADYFQERTEWDGPSDGTLRDEAYILRDFWEYLERRELDWRDTTDDVLRDWAIDMSMTKRVQRSIPQEHLQAWKIRSEVLITRTDATMRSQ